MTQLAEKILHKNGYDIVCDPEFGYYRASPTPSQAELDAYYGKKFYDHKKVDYFELQSRDQEWWCQVFDERYDLLENKLPADRRRILDFGSGPGFFLKRGLERGWRGIGVEPSPKAAEYARSIGVETHVGFLDDAFASKFAASFDVVYSNGVLEHVQDAPAVLRACHRLLAPGGLLFLCVANDFNPIQMVLWKDMGFEPWWVCPPEHLNYFQPDSLEALARACGFEAVESTGTFPIDLFLLMGENYVGNDTVGKQCHQRRKTLEFNLLKNGRSALKRDLYRKFREAGLGREIDLIARKA